jgi:hypothetical protein
LSGTTVSLVGGDPGVPMSHGGVSGDIASLSVVEIFLLCEEHWQEVRASGGCYV